MQNLALEKITHGAYSTEKHKFYKKKNFKKENTLVFHFYNGDVYRTMQLDNVNKETINLKCSKYRSTPVQTPCTARMTLKLSTILATIPKDPDQEKSRKKFVFSPDNDFEDYLKIRNYEISHECKKSCQYRCTTTHTCEGNKKSQATFKEHKSPTYCYSNYTYTDPRVADPISAPENDIEIEHTAENNVTK